MRRGELYEMYSIKGSCIIPNCSDCGEVVNIPFHWERYVYQESECNVRRDDNDYFIPEAIWNQAVEQFEQSEEVKNLIYVFNGILSDRLNDAGIPLEEAK